VDRARKVSHPGELNDAQRYLVQTLEFRSDGVAAIATQLRNALGDQGRNQAVNAIAAQMRNFDASDVIYSQRFVPEFQQQLKKQSLLDEVQVPKSAFLPDIKWLDPTYVADQIAGLRGGSSASGPATPGLHGTGLGSVSLGGQALSPGGSASVQLTNDLSFDVQVANQGENTETDVEVRITVGKGKDAIDLSGTLDTIAAGETKTVKVALDQQPPTGQQVPITVEIGAVPGEKKTDNNKQTYSAIFTK
jgi:hypothetical protein